MAASYEKIIDAIGNLTVLELAEFIKAFEEKFGVSAAMPVMAAAPAAGAAAPAAAEEKSEYKVTLKEAGSEKIKVIKAVREVMPDLALTEAKKLVDEAPSVIAEAAPKDKAKQIKEKLEAAGAKVELA